LKRLECADGAEEEELECEPFAWADTIKGHVGWDLEEHNSQGQHLLTDVELILCDANVFQ
jgi:hypothetical protein